MGKFTLAIFAMPSILAEAIAYRVSAPTGKPLFVSAYVTAPMHAALSAGPLALATYVITTIAHFLQFFFGPSPGLEMFWHRFSWTGSPIIYGSASLTEFVIDLIVVLTWLVASAVIAGQIKTWIRIGNVARSRSLAVAVRVANSDLVFNSYVLWFATMLLLAIASNGLFSSAGRYWITSLVPIVLLPTYYASRVLRKRRTRVAARRVALGTMLAFTLVSIACGVVSLDQRFYSVRPVVPPFEWLAHAERLTQSGHMTQIGSDVVPVEAAKPFVVSGWAVDSHDGGSAESISLVIDGRTVVGEALPQPNSEIAVKWNEPAFLRNAYTIHVKGLELRDRHELSLRIRERDGRAYRSIQSVVLAFHR